VVTRIVIILALSYCKVGISQNQFGFGISSGIGSLISKTELNESPKNTFRAPINFFSNIQLKFESFYKVQNNYLFEVDFEFSNYTFTANDRSINILFFPELRDGGGFTMAAGGKAKTLTFSAGKMYNFNKLHLVFSANLFFSKFNKQFYNLIGGMQTSSTSGVVTDIWQVVPYTQPNYYNNLMTLGIGFKPQFFYDIGHRMKFKFSAEINKGFVRLIDQTFLTKFISYVEPEKNAIYYNSVVTKGSNLKFYIGLMFFIGNKL
jgi:hypothetical protein